MLEWKNKIKNLKLQILHILMCFLFINGIVTKKYKQKQLYGIWILENYYSNNDTFKYSNNYEVKWGEILYFGSDSTFSDYLKVPCKVGLEEKAHKYSGKWRLKNDRIIVYNLKEEWNGAHYKSKFKDSSDMRLNETGEFKIITLENHKLQIKRTIDYEIKLETKVKNYK